MKVNPAAQYPPVNDKEDSEQKGGGSLMSFANQLKEKIIQGKPDFLPLLKYYGFKKRKDLYYRHRHHRTGKGFTEIHIGGFSSVVTYVVFFIDFIIRLIYVLIYLLLLCAIIIVLARGLQIPEYVIELYKSAQ